MRVRAYLGLGANLGQPIEQITQALERLARPYTEVVRRAPWYGSHPMGPPDQPTYVNTAVEIETELSPIALLAEVKAIERRFGRLRSETRWGPRPLDIDILLYGDLVRDTPALTIPHPGLTERRFVLIPLAALEPTLIVPPTGRSVAELLRELDDDPASTWPTG